MRLPLRVQPLAGMPGEPFPQPAVQLGAVGCRVAEHLRRCPVRVAHKGQQALKLAGFQRQQFHIAVGCRHYAADAEIAGKAGFGDALGLVALDGHIAYGQLSFLGGGVHQLAAPWPSAVRLNAVNTATVTAITAINAVSAAAVVGAHPAIDGGQGAHGGGQAGLVVAHIAAGHDGGAVRESVQRQSVGQQPALAAGVKDGQMPGAVIGIGAAAAKGGGGDDDDIRVGGEQGIRVQPGGHGGGRGVVVDDHINPARQPAQQSLTGGVRQVEGNRLLAGVQVQIQPAAFRVGNVVGEGAAPAGRVAGGGRFRLDDRGAQGRQQLAAVGAGD